MLKSHQQDKQLLERLNEVYERYWSKEVVMTEESEKMNESDDETVADEDEAGWKKKFGKKKSGEYLGLGMIIIKPTTINKSFQACHHF